ncbi:MAG: hypothetical protein ACXWJ5_08770 [Xanthobacteraceae bacterium]
MDGIMDGIAFGLLIVAQFLAVIVVANNRHYSAGTKKTFTRMPMSKDRSRTVG